jgi:hypothetical protein
LKTGVLLAVVVLIVSSILAGVYISSNFQTQSASSTNMSTVTSLTSAVATSTHSTSCTSNNILTSTTSIGPPSTQTTTTIASSSSYSVTTAATTQTVNGAFSYSPSYPVAVQAVQAILSRNESDNEYVTFSISLRNVGNTSIYIIKGCGSSLVSSIGNSTVLQKVSGAPLCLCAEALTPFDPGQNETLTTPGCWSGYTYKVIGSGTTNMNFVLSWEPGSQNFSSSGSMSISATFRF